MSSWTSNYGFSSEKCSFQNCWVHVFQEANKQRYIKQMSLTEKGGHFWENSDGRMDVSTRKWMCERIWTARLFNERRSFNFWQDRCFWEISIRNTDLSTEDSQADKKKSVYWQKDGHSDVSEDGRKAEKAAFLNERWKLMMKKQTFWKIWKPRKNQQF